MEDQAKSLGFDGVNFMDALLEALRDGIETHSLSQGGLIRR